MDSWLLDNEAIETHAENYLNGNLSEVRAWLDVLSPAEAVYAGARLYERFVGYSNFDAETFVNWLGRCVETSRWEAGSPQQIADMAQTICSSCDCNVTEGECSCPPLDS